MNRIALLGAGALSLAALVGCQQMGMDHKDHATTMNADAAGQKVAVATIKPAQAAATQPSWGTAAGTVTFTQDGDKVKIHADLTGLKPGKHGIHIHEKGDMAAPDLMSTGGHYNPDKHVHGGPTTSPVHAGDFGNITADDSGKATLDLTVDDISVGGAKNDVVGKALIIHAKEDDLSSQPSGNAGARIAGGVIELQK